MPRKIREITKPCSEKILRGTQRSRAGLAVNLMSKKGVGFEKAGNSNSRSMQGETLFPENFEFSGDFLQIILFTGNNLLKRSLFPALS